MDLVASLLVNLGFCRIRFWYPVASGSGISRKTCRIYFLNLTRTAPVCAATVAGGAAQYSEAPAVPGALHRLPRRKPARRMLTSQRLAQDGEVFSL